MGAYPRWQEQALKKRLAERRIVLLAGPRQCGKTTLARRIVPPGEYRTLDDPTFRNAAEADPAAFVVSETPPLVIDEVQRVPDLLPPLKQQVDDTPRPGRYLLTGSAEIQRLPTVQESLAGRIGRVRLRPLTVAEIAGRAESGFLAAAFALTCEGGEINRDTLLEQALCGGFPEAVRLPAAGRAAWHRDMLAALLDRDLADIVKIRRRRQMEKLLEMLAAWSGKFMNMSTICSGLSIRRPTVESYISALEALYLVERVPPWAHTDYARVSRHDKLFMADPGLMAALLDWTPEKVRFDPDRAGKLLETFVFHELAARVDATAGACRLFHYRDNEGREIDFLIERRRDGALLGVEVKAGTAGPGDFKWLKWFRDTLAGDRPFAGIVLHAGPTVSFGDGMKAVSFSSLWEGAL